MSTLINTKKVNSLQQDIGNVLDGISLAHDLVAALPVAVHVVHAMPEIGTSVIQITLSISYKGHS